MATLRISTERLGEVREIVDLLRLIESAYNHLYAFELLIKEVVEQGRFTDRWARIPGKPAALRRIRDPAVVVLPEDRLRLAAVSVTSPGFWKFEGILDALETIRKYLADRHERIKDREFRNDAERERLALENERLRTEVVAGRINVLRQVGFSEDRIREALTKYVVDPLSRLDQAQQSGLIDGAEIIDESEGDDPQSSG